MFKISKIIGMYKICMKSVCNTDNILFINALLLKQRWLMKQCSYVGFCKQ